MMMPQDPMQGQNPQQGAMQGREAMHYAHMNKPEVGILAQMQGGENRNEHGFPDLSGVGEIFKNPQVMQMVMQALQDAGGVEGMRPREYAQGGHVAERMREAGRHGDGEIVMMPHHMRHALKMAAGGHESINPKTGYPEYFEWGNFFGAILP